MNMTSIDLSAFKQLKMAAKRLSKSSGKKHTECLELVAREHGFPNWHRVTQAYAPYRAALDAWKEGIVVIWDWKDAESVNRNMLIENDWLFEIAFPSMLQHADVEDLERPLSEQDFHEVFDYWFHAFFLKADTIPSNLDLNWLHSELKKYSFFMPLATFWKGEPVFGASQILDSVPPVKSFAYSW